MSTDMTGKHVVLTGASAGLGFEAAVALLEAGASPKIYEGEKLEAKCQVICFIC